MALYKQVEFAALCGISKAALSVNKARGKVIVEKELIDDTVPVNYEFLRRHLGKKKEQPIKTDYPAVDYHQTASEKNAKRPPRDELLSADQSKLSYNDLEKLKKQVDIRLVEERTELLRKQNEKMAGESLPTDMVKALFTQHFKSVTTSFKHSIERLLTDLAKKKDFSHEEIADIRGKLTTHLNTAIRDSVNESKKTVAQIATSIVVKKELEPVEEPE